MFIQENQKIFKKLGITYLEKTVISPEIEILINKSDEKKSEYYINNRNVFTSLNLRYADLVINSHMAPVKIGYIKELSGYGLFAGKDLKENELIGEYTGIIQHAQSIEAVMNSDGKYNTDYSWDYPVPMDEGSDLEINAYQCGNELRFVNHSFTPNCRADHFLLGNRWVIIFYALQSINKNDQILADYGEEYWAGGIREMILM